EVKAALGQQQQQHLLDQAAALQARQQREEDETILPKVGLEDVPAQTPMPPFTSRDLQSGKHSLYVRGTNGLVYQQVFYDLPTLSDDQLQLLPLFSHFAGELGAGEDDYLTIQERISAVSGGVHGFSVMRGLI